MTNSELQNKLITSNNTMNEFELLRELEDRFDVLTTDQPNTVVIPEKEFLKNLLKRIYEARLKELEKRKDNNNIRIYKALTKDLTNAIKSKLITYNNVWNQCETETELALTKDQAENYSKHFEIQFLG